MIVDYRTDDRTNHYRYQRDQASPRERPRLDDRDSPGSANVRPGRMDP
jgi:hypothetical protein